MNRSAHDAALRPSFARLVDDSLGIAQRMLEDVGEFLPYLALQGPRGNTRIVHCDDPRLSTLEGGLIERLEDIAQSTPCRAYAVIYDALTSEPDALDAEDTIAVRLQHADGTRQLALMPYGSSKTGVGFAPLAVQTPRTKVD